MNRLLVRLLLIQFLIFNNISAIAVDTKGMNHSDLGRLFTTAKQRAKIENLKLMSNKQIKAHLSKDVSQPRTISHNQTINSISVHGIVKKNNGLVLTWSRQNGRLKHTRSHQHKRIDTILRDVFSIRFKLDKNASPIEIRPGQTYLTTGNKVLDDWQIDKDVTPKVNKSAESPQTKK